MRKIISHFIYYSLALLVVPVIVFADSGEGCCDGNGYVSGGHMSGIGHGWASPMLGYGWISFFIAWSLFILFLSFLIFYLIKVKENEKRKDSISVGDDKEFIRKGRTKNNKNLNNILKERLVNGEVSHDEYEKIKSEIEK